MVALIKNQQCSTLRRCADTAERMSWSKIAALALGLRLLFMWLWYLPPVSDFKLYLEIAQTLAQTPASQWSAQLLGDYLAADWPGLAPFVLYEALVLRAFSQGQAALILINVLFSAAACLLTGAMARRLYGERAGRLAAVLLALNPYLLFFSSVLTNQHMASFFLLAAVALCLKASGPWNWLRHLCAGLLAAVAHLLRPEMQVLLIAVAGYWVYEVIWALRDRTARPGRALTQAVVCLLCFWVSFSGLISMTDAGLQRAGVLESSLRRSKLEYKLLIGMNADSHGTWNEADARLYAEKPEKAREELVSRLSEPLQVWRLMTRKFWTLQLIYSTDFACPTTPEGRPSTPHRVASSALSTLYMWMILGLLARACWRKLRRNPQIRHADFLPLLTLVGFMLAFCLFETQGRYMYGSIPLMTLLCVARRDPAPPPGRPDVPVI